MRRWPTDLVGLANEFSSKCIATEAVEAYLSRTSTAEVCVENGQISLVRHWDEEESSVKDVRNGALGFAYSTGISFESLLRLRDRAREMAIWVGYGPHPGFPEPSEVAKMPAVAPRMTSLNDLFVTAKRILHMLQPYRMEFRLEFLKLTSSHEEIAIANSRGLNVDESLTRFEVEALGVARRGREVSSLQFMHDGGVRLEEVDMEQSVLALAERAAACLGAGPAPNWSDIPVLLAPSAVHQLLIETVVRAADGYSVLAGRSQWARSLGKVVASPFVTVTDDNALPGFLGTCRYDRDGQAMAPLRVLEDGRLINFLLDHATAYRLDLSCTRRAGGGAESLGMVSPTNIVMEAGNMSFAKLLEAVKRGVYIERLALNNHSPNGDFFGSIKGGRLIEAGRLTRPITGSVLSGNTFMLLRKVAGVSSEREKLGNCLLPYVSSGPGELRSS